MRHVSLLVAAACGSWLSAVEVGGTWTHRDEDGQESTLVLTQAGQGVSGTYTEGGVGSAVSGTLDAQGFNGQVQVAGEVMPVRAVRQGRTLVVLVQEPGESEPTRLVFRAAGGQAAAPAAAAAPGAAAAVPAAAAPAAVAAQAPAGLERLDAVGAAFALPAGFTVQRSPQGLLAVDQARGLALAVFTHHDRNAADLGRHASETVEDGGVVLRPAASESCRHAGAEGIAVSYQGTANGAPAEARGIALVAPAGGGPAFLLIAKAGGLDPAALAVLTAVADSVRFYTPTVSPLVAQARARLAGRTLSWFSSGGTYTGGSWSSQRSLALGADGRFRRGGESANSGANGQFAGASGDAGSWECTGHGAGVALLLRGDDGSLQTLPIELTEKPDVIRLGGQQWILPP